MLPPAQAPVLLRTTLAGIHRRIMTIMPLLAATKKGKKKKAVQKRKGEKRKERERERKRRRNLYIITEECVCSAVYSDEAFVVGVRRASEALPLKLNA